MSIMSRLESPKCGTKCQVFRRLVRPKNLDLRAQLQFSTRRGLNSEAVRCPSPQSNKSCVLGGEVGSDMM